MTKNITYTRGMFSAEISKSPFWLECEKRYDAESRSEDASATAGDNFWLKDDMEYTVTTVQSMGLFATVWRGRTTSTGRLFAVKRFEKGETYKVREQVLREVQILDAARKCVSMSTSYWSL